MKDNIIVDLDGTLSLDHVRAKQYLHLPCGCDKGMVAVGYTCVLCNGKGKIHMWDEYFAACEEDVVNEAVWEIMDTFYPYKEITILSGRSDVVYDRTVAWLKKNNVPYHDLWLRPKDSRIDDFVLKVSQAKKMGMTPENTLFVLEDRQRVVDAWRASGYTCLQVAPGNF